MKQRFLRVQFLDRFWQFGPFSVGQHELEGWMYFHGGPRDLVVELKEWNGEFVFPPHPEEFDRCIRAICAMLDESRGRLAKRKRITQRTHKRLAKKQCTTTSQ